jgi:hypothetical protein
MKRTQLAEEIKLRGYIREAIRAVKAQRATKKKTEWLEEQKLRSLVRRLLTEAAASGGTPETPHRSTGINVLEDLLKKIIPILEDEYKILTTNPDQRKSYRAHIVNAVQNALAPEIAIADAGKEEPDAEAEEIALQEQDIEVEIGDDEEQFIDVRGEDQPAADPEEEFGAGLENEDVTGRNFAMKTFEKVEKVIVDAYAVLSDDEDREVFYDYLLTNLKLYFDKFEEELAAELDEPTTPEYEEESEAASEYDAEEVGGEEDLGDLDLEL